MSGMLDTPSIHAAEPQQPATAILVDLRNFTAHLYASTVDAEGVNVFCRFLSGFHALCLDACLLAFPPSQRADPALYMQSTGDGAIVVFTDPKHHATQAMLGAIVMHRALERLCGYYNQTLPPNSVLTSFGIGVESGEVGRISARPTPGARGPVIDTYIGQCINVASRVQEVTKTLHSARTIFSENTNNVLCRSLFGVDYPGLMREAEAADVADHRRMRLHDEMNEINRSLCLAFLHQHKLRGLDVPMALFRLSESSVRLGNPRFEALLPRLCGGAEHLAQVRAALE
jgi:class 3 adenylate cyclase